MLEAYLLKVCTALCFAWAVQNVSAYSQGVGTAFTVPET